MNYKELVSGMKLELEEVRLRQLSKSVTPEQQGEGVRGEGVKGGGGREVKMVEGERVDNNKDLTTALRQQVCVYNVQRRENKGVLL